MTAKAWGNEYRSTIVCIDSYEKGVLAGRLFNPCLNSGQTFESLTQFLFQMEQILDSMKFPQSYTVTRSFTAEPRTQYPEAETDFREGEAATFVVRVFFRQNASWQGVVVWQEGGKEESFRSVLELIFLMDSALNSTKENGS